MFKTNASKATLDTWDSKIRISTCAQWMVQPGFPRPRQRTVGEGAAVVSGDSQLRSP
jgi:hypothetical protein